MGSLTDGTGMARSMPPNRQFSGHVRQLVDSLPYKEEVRGSSPFVPTTFDLGIGIWDLGLPGDGQSHPSSEIPDPKFSAGS